MVDEAMLLARLQEKRRAAREQAKAAGRPEAQKRKVLPANQRAIEACKEPGTHHIEGVENLYLQVTSPTARSWIYKYRSGGTDRHKGLGSLRTVTLAEARKRATDYRATLDRGIDPLAKQVPASPASGGRTFKEAAEALIEKRKPLWAKKRARMEAKTGAPRGSTEAAWKSQLMTYVYPTIGEKPCRDVTVDDVEKILDPIWRTAHVTATRVRSKIHEVLNIEYLRNQREWGVWHNPATTKLVDAVMGEVKHKPKAFARVEPEDAPGVYQRLAARDTDSSVALRFQILCGVRPVAMREAMWTEIDFERAVWTVPADRFFEDGPALEAALAAARKTGEKGFGSGTKGIDVEVPLSSEALAILSARLDLRRPVDLFVFPGKKPGETISQMTTNMCMKRLGLVATPHGWRSTFRDWGERNGLDRRLMEYSLGHEIGHLTEAGNGRVEGRYQRDRLLEQRRPIMQRWADYLLGKEPG